MQNCHRRQKMVALYRRDHDMNRNARSVGSQDAVCCEQLGAGMSGIS
jgi:hypothetical protein